MKVTKIEKNDNIYHVTLTPNWFEKLFGIKEKVNRFKEKGTSYVFGGGNVYIRSDGKETKNGSKIGKAIDRWGLKF